MWCLRRRGWGKGTKPAGVVNFSLLSTPPTLGIRKDNARPAYSGLDSALSEAVGAGDGKVADCVHHGSYAANRTLHGHCCLIYAQHVATYPPISGLERINRRAILLWQIGGWICPSFSVQVQVSETDVDTEYFVWLYCGESERKSII